MESRDLLILIISSEFPPGPGGIGQHAASLANALAQQHKVWVLANQDYAAVEEIKDYNISIESVFTLEKFAPRNGRFTSIKRILQAMKLANEIRPDIVFVTGRFPLWIGALLKSKNSNLRVEGFAHGTEISMTQSVMSKITAFAYKKLDRIIAVSNYTAGLLSKSVKKENVKIVPNGLDDQFIKDSRLNKSYDRYNWTGQPALLTVGNLTNRKGQHRVINALPEILERFPNAHYHIVGLPTNSEKIKKLANKLGVGAHVTIHGRLRTRQELYRAYVSADLFIMLSENQSNGDLEGFGIAILEANAFGIPAIGAKGCGIEDAINGNNGILVDGDSSIEIVNAIDILMKNADQFELESQKWAEQHNWQNLIKELL